MSRLYFNEKYLTLAYKKDIFFKNRVFNKLINQFVKKGMKQKALWWFYKAFFRIRLLFGLNPFKLLLYIISDLKPLAEVKHVKLAGRKVGVPFPVTIDRQFKLSTKFFYKYVNQSSKFNIEDRLLQVLKDYILLKSKANILKYNLYEKVVDSRAFAHFRWK